MADIKKITIKGSSGYCCADEAFNDEVTITEDMISYEYKPLLESELNPIRKWSYKTNSPIYRMKYETLVEMMPDIIDIEIEEICTDIGGIKFNIEYSDNTEFKKVYWIPGDRFADCFRLIKSLVPECEYVPAVLLTKEDYNEG